MALGISAVVPVYNEGKKVEHSVKKILSELKKITKNVEIVIVESGSTDETPKIVDGLSKKHKEVRSYHQKRKEGLGSAIRYGFSKSTKDYVLYMDGDDPFDVKVISKALPLLKNADAVLGFRKGGRESFKRWFFSKSYNFLIRIVFGVRVKDVNFSFKLLTRRVLKKIKLKSNGFFIDAEIVAELQKHRFIIKELGILYTQRQEGNSTVSIGPKLITNMLGEMFRYIRR